MSKKKLKEKSLKIGWQYLPRKKKKLAKKLFEKILSKDYIAKNNIANVPVSRSGCDHIRTGRIIDDDFKVKCGWCSEEVSNHFG